MLNLILTQRLEGGGPDAPDKKDESDLFLASDLDLSKGGEECSIDAKHRRLLKGKLILC